MVNVYEVKKFENEFKEILNQNKENKNREFKISGIIAVDKKKSLIDLTKVISCSENFYEDLIKIYYENEFVYTINKDSKISFAGKGILYLIVENNSTLELEFISKRFNASFVKILVKENVKLNSIIYSDSPLGYNNMEFIIEKNSEVNVCEIIFNTKLLHIKTKLEKNVKYDLKTAYLLKESNSYILNKVIHLEENSTSDIEVNGSAHENSKVICEGFAKIEKNAFKSMANQSLKGMILDDTSSISGEPILEIQNSDVKCSHAFSISKISEDILFYMSSRGITKDEAIALVMKGFFYYSLEKQDEKLSEKYQKLIEKNF